MDSTPLSGGESARLLSNGGVVFTDNATSQLVVVSTARPETLRAGRRGDVADLLLDVEQHAAIFANPRRNAKDHTSAAERNSIHDRGTWRHDTDRRLRRDRHFVADLQKGLFVVEHSQRRRRHDVDLGHV